MIRTISLRPPHIIKLTKTRQQLNYKIAHYTLVCQVNDRIVHTTAALLVIEHIIEYYISLKNHTKPKSLCLTLHNDITMVDTSPLINPGRITMKGDTPGKYKHTLLEDFQVDSFGFVGIQHQTRISGAAYIFNVCEVRLGKRV